MMNRNPSSFRDSSGYVFSHENKIYRWISPTFSEQFDKFAKSDLYAELVGKKWLISHQASKSQSFEDMIVPGSQVIEPEQLEIVSYPYEWSFTQLKESALLTLDLCLEGLKKGYILKDASAYNVQLLRGKPTFIDSLSFVAYEPDKSWVGYRQFIYHFLNPLLLMSKVDPHLNNLLRIYLDGVPSSLTASMLPWLQSLHPIVFMNVKMHAKLEKHYENKQSVGNTKVPKSSLVNMLTALRGFITGLNIKADPTEWAQYYSATNYTERSFDEKNRVILGMLESIGYRFSRLLDLGANDGTFSRKIAHLADVVISADIDPIAVEKNLLKNRDLGVTNIYPLRIDFTNPSPNIGWNCKERGSFFDRAAADAVVCLAFIHHMVIGQNISFEMVASSLAQLSRNLIIEFVHEKDSQVQRLLATRTLNHKYDSSEFENSFKKYFTIKESVPIRGTDRTVYLMKKI
ncbi:MAG: class I SAM-dependent methyltransferase [Sphingobacteriales bacterium]|nr:MAG: class I SAM-dependent methyltransferase [Sphingobacteriales bacterium]